MVEVQAEKLFSFFSTLQQQMCEAFPSFHSLTFSRSLNSNHYYCSFYTITVNFTFSIYYFLECDFIAFATLYMNLNCEL